MRILAIGSEQAEIYSDPFDITSHEPQYALTAVPQIPFGYLNGAWRNFRSGMSSEATLWSDEAFWENNWGGQEINSGNAEVRDGAVLRFFDGNITHERT